MRRRRSLSVVAAGLLIVLTPAVARAGDWGAQAEDDAYVVNAFEAEAELRRSRSADPAITPTATTSAPFTVEERRSRLVDDLCTDIPRPDDC